MLQQLLGYGHRTAVAKLVVLGRDVMGDEGIERGRDGCVFCILFLFVLVMNNVAFAYKVSCYFESL